MIAESDLQDKACKDITEFFVHTPGKSLEYSNTENEVSVVVSGEPQLHSALMYRFMEECELNIMLYKKSDTGVPHESCS